MAVEFGKLNEKQILEKIKEQQEQISTEAVKKRLIVRDEGVKRVIVRKKRDSDTTNSRVLLSSKMPIAYKISQDLHITNAHAPPSVL